jgi:K+/H+ antiporter YhaU regulatory subunit KhtT
VRRRGATAVAIAHASDGVVVPTGDERLHEDDVVELVGPCDAVDAAARLLAQRAAASASLDL